MPTVSLNWDEAAEQISRETNSFGTPYQPTLGAPISFTYGYRSTDSAPTPPEWAPSWIGGRPAGVDDFIRFNEQQILLMELALQMIEDVTLITFNRNGTGTTGEGAYTDEADILFANFSAGTHADAGVGGLGYWQFWLYEGQYYRLGKAVFNVDYPTIAAPTFANGGLALYLHETLHTLTMAHPGNYDITNGDPITYETHAEYIEDSELYTVMSYFGAAEVGVEWGGFGPMTLMMHDIAALQLIFGANMTTRADDTIYGFNSNTGLESYTLNIAESRRVFTIWDGGGNDTIDFSGFNTNSIINLNEESFSSGGVLPGDILMEQNVAIARGVVVENAIGGSASDTLIGNSAANVLSGNAGNDTMTGNAGNDTLNGGAGIDWANYHTNSSSTATWHRNPNGTWTVDAGEDGTDTLSNVEFLSFNDRDVFLDRANQTFTGDGTSDLLLRHTNGTLSAWFVNGASITGAGMGSIGANWYSLSGDFNGDGRDDLLWRNTSNGAMSMWFMNGAATSPQAFSSVATNWIIEGLGDFNGDGRDDILWRNSSNGSMSLWFLNGTAVSGGAFGSISSNWVVEGVGDFNGDGRDDILWRNSSTNAMSMWFMDGQAVTGGAFGSVSQTWMVEGTGDFNGDGREDIFWRNGNTGDVSLWFMNGQAVTSTAGFGISGAWSPEAVGDYNGDGRDDIIWRNDSTGGLVAWFVNGNSVTGQSLGTLSSDWVIDDGG